MHVLVATAVSMTLRAQTPEPAVFVPPAYCFTESKTAQQEQKQSKNEEDNLWARRLSETRDRRVTLWTRFRTGWGIAAFLGPGKGKRGCIISKYTRTV